MRDMVLVGTPLLGSQLAHHLRRGILSGELEPDAHLKEVRVAETYGVSRGPVREALRELERDGMVYSASQGYRVSALTRADIEEVYSIRFMVESMGIEAAQAAGVDWGRLTSLARELLVAAQEGDQERFATLDMEFHRHFCEVGGGKRLQTIWGTVEPTLRALFEINPLPAEGLVASAEEHLLLCRYLEAGSGQWRGILKKHLDGAGERFLYSLEQRSIRREAT